jgi:hypothetical protein
LWDALLAKAGNSWELATIAEKMKEAFPLVTLATAVEPEANAAVTQLQGLLLQGAEVDALELEALERAARGKTPAERYQEAIEDLVLGVGASGEAWRLLPPTEREEYDVLQRAATAILAEGFRAKWDYTRNAGSLKHEGYDLYVQHKPVPEHIKLPLGFKRAMALLTKKYDVYGSEIPITDEVARVIGCFDLLLIDRETGELVVADFKNCGTDDLASSGGREYGCHPFTKHLKGTKFNHYRFQVSFYRHILELHYFPGRMSKTCILININPADPDCCQIHYLEAMDMVPFWRYLTQRIDPAKPTGQQQDDSLIFKELVPTLVPTFADDDPRCKGPTTRVRLPRQGPKGQEDPMNGVVWTQNACKSKGYPELPKSDWAHPDAKWFGAAPPGVAESYELHLLNSPRLLLRMRTELVGKKLACWCYDDAKTKCNCEVLVKYANLWANGAFDLGFLEGLSLLELTVLEENQRTRATANLKVAKEASAATTPKRKKVGRGGQFRAAPLGEIAFVVLGKERGL